MKKRIILMSDVHLCHADWYGPDSETRLRKMVEDLKAENEKFPIDMIFILGDMSLDYWECPPYGSYSVNGISNTEKFIKEIAIDFPCPFYFIPGNHEQYSHEDWERLMGAKRQFYVIWDDIIIFMLDNFGDNLNAEEHNHGTYSFTDVKYIKNVMAEHPDKKAVLCAHDFDVRGETDEFKALVREETVLGMFAGHIHYSYIEQLSEEYGNKKIYRTGQYSYTNANPVSESMWGFRELVKKGNSLETAYITPENKYFDGGKEITHKYGKQECAVII